MDIISNIRSKYNDLTKKLEELKLEEEKLDEESISLRDIFNSCNKSYSDSCDIYMKVNNRLINKKKDYIFKKHFRHINLVMLITFLCAFSCASIYSTLGFVINKFLNIIFKL